MQYVDGPISFGEWMPDAKDLQFPNLLDASNVEPFNTVYKSFAPLVDTGGPAVPGGFLRGFHRAVSNSIVYTYAANDMGIFESFGGGAFTARSATMTPTQYDFVQFDTLELVQPSALHAMYRTLGSTSNFATLGSSSGTAPVASRIGKIGQFVLIGNTADGPHVIQWSGIDNPLSWPTPNSATAIAQQAGEQFLNPEFGEVTGFANGDQHGLVFQQSAVTRVTYVGPPVVFQFDKISEKVGCPYPRSIVQVGGLTYFVSSTGFFKTDGVSVIPIGHNKVDSYFNTHSIGAAERIYGAVNIFRNLIYWAYCNVSDVNSLPSNLIIYNYAEDRFTMADQFAEGILSTTGTENYLNQEIAGFGVDNTLGAFSSSTSGSFIQALETGDVELNPGGRAFLSGAKIICDQTSNALVAYCISRNDLASQTTSSASTATSATGFSDFRIDARYHRMRWEIPGVFSQAQAMEFIAKPSGGR